MNNHPFHKVNKEAIRSMFKKIDQINNDRIELSYLLGYMAAIRNAEDGFEKSLCNDEAHEDMCDKINDVENRLPENVVIKISDICEIVHRKHRRLMDRLWR